MLGFKSFTGPWHKRASWPGTCAAVRDICDVPSSWSALFGVNAGTFFKGSRLGNKELHHKKIPDAFMKTPTPKLHMYGQVIPCL